MERISNATPLKPPTRTTNNENGLNRPKSGSVGQDELLVCIYVLVGKRISFLLIDEITIRYNYSTFTNSSTKAYERSSNSCSCVLLSRAL